MAHFRCPTFNILNSHIPNLNHLTLASHNKPSLSPSISSPNSSWGLQALLPRSRLEDSEFQSNAQIETTSVSPSLAGLGIRYAEHPKNSLSTNGNGPTSLSASLSQPDCLTESVDEFGRLFEVQLPPSWSLGSPTSGYTSSSAGTLNPTGSSCGENVILQQPHLDDSTWTLDSIATASGISVHDLAAQLSCTAEMTLQYMAEGSSLSFSSLVDLGSSETVFNDSGPEDWPVLPDHKIDLTPVLEADTHKAGEPWGVLSLGINPADIMGCESEYGELQYPIPQSSSNMSTFSFCRSLEPSAKKEGVSSFISDICIDPKNAAATSENGGYYHILQHDSDKENSDYELGDGASSRDSSPFPSPRPRKRSQGSKRTRANHKIYPVMKTQVPLQPAVRTNEPDDIHLGTPVFDAHKGIYLGDLRSKAERYRLRNPGLSYDNRWLVAFAGKLSAQGELVNEFRCYVIGCSQTNKRRDHILIHVGAHLDQRPYECTYWCVSYLLTIISY